MTREEAIKILEENKPTVIFEDEDVQKCMADIRNALEMAIKALEQEPCNDAVSRQAVLDALTKTSGIRGDALKALYDLPSINPQEPKTGLGDILIADQCECENCIHEEMCKWKEERHGQECAYMEPQESEE